MISEVDRSVYISFYIPKKDIAREMEMNFEEENSPARRKMSNRREDVPETSINWP
jgi:hypothetical protein